MIWTEHQFDACVCHIDHPYAYYNMTSLKDAKDAELLILQLKMLESKMQVAVCSKYPQAVTLTSRTSCWWCKSFWRRQHHLITLNIGLPKEISISKFTHPQAEQHFIIILWMVQVPFVLYNTSFFISHQSNDIHIVNKIPF